MENKYKYRSLLVFALVLATYGIHSGMSQKPVAITSEETIVEAPGSTPDEPVASVAVHKVRAHHVAKTADPAEEIFERFGNNSQSIAPRFIEHMGVKIDLSEIDLLVETEIAAGTIKSRKDIQSFRLRALDKKALQIREGLAQQNGRSRWPTSTR